MGRQTQERKEEEEFFLGSRVKSESESLGCVYLGRMDRLIN